MKKQLITTAIVIALTTHSAATFAAENDNAIKPTMIGFGSGAVVGAIVAGPLGAIVASTIGLLIGNSEELKDQKQSALASLETNQQQLNAITKQKRQLMSSLNQYENQNKMLTKQLSLANNTLNTVQTLEQLKLNLQFKVNSSNVESLYQNQVKQLAELVKQTPEMKVHLAGFADRNGDEDKNLALSAQRVAAVKAMLIAQGIAEENIVSTAFGESSPTNNQQDYQNDFYDRRVEIKLQPQELTASNH